MSIDSHAARITRKDVVELAKASEQLGVAADTIRGMGPKWGEAVVNLMIAANETIVRIQNKGAAAFARYLEKHGPKEPPLMQEIEKLDAELNQLEKIDSGEPEDD